MSFFVKYYDETEKEINYHSTKISKYFNEREKNRSLGQYFHV
jgi:hypothetical protein